MLFRFEHITAYKNFSDLTMIILFKVLKFFKPPSHYNKHI